MICGHKKNPDRPARKTRQANPVESRTNIVSLSIGAKIKAGKIIYCVGYESATMIPEKFADLISTYAIVSEVEPEMSREYQDLLIWNTADPYI